jgi:hypothetical protein
MNHDDTPFVAFLKVVGIWLAVGVSHMSPLQFVQFLAAIAAFIYTTLQIVGQVRGWWAKRSKHHANR